VLALDVPVAEYLPAFATNNKGAVTVQHLLTHTSGFAPDPAPPLYPNYTTRAERRRAVIAQALANPPGTVYTYSDLNFMNLGFVLEATTGRTLDELVHERLTAKIGMRDTFYNRGNKPAGRGNAPVAGLAYRASLLNPAVVQSHNLTGWRPPNIKSRCWARRLSHPARSLFGARKFNPSPGWTDTHTGAECTTRTRGHWEACPAMPACFPRRTISLRFAR
jgi:CubicO group peptidase (beta-lactamase class C family)